ncbi:Cell division protein FtsN [Candidatus Erwinia haradaeae]|uniref:Cell division protein FtsN, partial n=1 Tax=Candidatus Erwinia haradaeae TaxID=1922217 RepID=A0A451CYS7_9GAMM|nr:hypothetical protein [Candidatus Erwinia haradaeae]VFP78518.1 Cell division protein FtsN [Candidatus Erwinia haradaeae]
MIHKDYVNRERAIGLGYKNPVTVRIKRNSGILTIALAMVILVQSIFIGIFFFMIPEKSCVMSVTPTHHEHEIGSPPKPEERWYYIKQLEKKKFHISVFDRLY